MRKNQKDRKYRKAVKEYERAEAAKQHKDRFATVYCTTFCNHGHRLGDGKPVGHECYVLNVRVLRFEDAFGASKAIEMMKEKGLRLHSGVVHRGIKE